MTPSALLLWVLLQSVGVPAAAAAAAAVTSQCHQGATFSEAVLPPALGGGGGGGVGVLRVRGVASLPGCVAACCATPRCDLAWLFQGRCYVLLCQQGAETCRPRERPGADSYLAFVRRGPPQAPLVLGSLVRGEPYEGRWGGSPSAAAAAAAEAEVSEAPGDLEALRDLAVLEAEEEEEEEEKEGPRHRGGGGGGGVGGYPEAGAFSHWPEEEIEDRVGAGGAVTGSSSPANGSWGGPSPPGAPGGPLGEQRPTFHPAENRDGSPSTTPALPSPWKRTTDSTQEGRIRTSLPTEAPPQPSVTTATPTTTADRDQIEASISPAPPTESRGEGLLRWEWEQISGPSLDLGQPADTWTLYLAHLEPGNYTFRVTVADAGGSSDSTAAAVLVLPPDTSPPPAGTPTSAPPSTTTDPTATPPPGHDADPALSSPTPVPPQRRSTPTPVTVQVPGPPAEAGPVNRGPVAVAGPDRKLVLPVSSVTLDGSDSSDDRGVVGYHWEATSGPPGLRMEGVDGAVATATGLRAGRYTFRLTVSDQQGETDSAVLTVRVEEARLLPPVAHASGSHTLTLPNSSLVLRGSVTDGDQSQVHFLWTRDSQSPAAGDVLYGSRTAASLHLANLVEGTYLFQLRVTDAQGRGSAATATVEVRPDPAAREEVDMEVLVGVAQVSVAQRDTVVRQLAALLHVLDRSIQLRILPGHSHLSAVLRLSVGGPEGSLPGSRLVQVLRTQLLREKTDYLLFRVLRVDTVFCLLRCSGRGQCDPITKECVCDPFWTENLIRRFLGDRERNCEWRMLYVVMSSFLSLVLVLIISWSLVCCCRRRKRSKVRRKTKYTILDDMEDQERVELRPKHGLKHRSTEHASSLMMSESEPDSDQDTVFSRDRPVRSRAPGNAARNGNAFG